MAVMYKNFGIINKVEQRNYYGFPIRSASGSIAQFSDGANDVPIADGVFDIDYDANGYSAMRIGKSAKNLCGGEFLLSNAQAYISSGQVDTINKTFTYAASAAVTSGIGGFSGIQKGKYKENTVYTIYLSVAKSGTSSTRTNLMVYYTDGASQAIPMPTNYTANTKYVVLFTTNGAKTLDYLSKQRNTDDTILYYDECGIFEGVLTAQDFEAWSGETHELNFQLGKNLIKPLTYQRTANNLRIGVDTLDGRISLKAGTYTVSVKTALSSMIFRYVEGGSVARDLTTTDTTDGRTATFTITANDDSCFIDCYNSNGVTAADISEIMLEKGQEKTTYEPFTYIYGGYYDSVSGVLVSTKAADGTDLATPVEYQLQPVEIIQAQGQNNVWNDTGDTLAEYRGFSNVSSVLDCVALAYTNNNEMIFDNQYASDSPAYAVSAKNESYWLTPDPTNSYIGYKFASPVVVNAYEMRARNNGNNYDISQSPRYWIIQGSNDDGVTWENVFESGHEFTASGERFAEAFGNTTKAFKWWRMFITTAKQTDEGTALAYLMFKTISFEE